MPAWIAAALRLLATGIGGGVGFGLGGELLGSVGEDDPNFIGPRQPRMLEGGGLIHIGGHRRRRRRRRALTASDRADIAFIAGIVSKSAAKDFAVQLATRSR